MLYMTNDRNEVFKTEKECLEYKQNKEKLEMERQNRLNSIIKKYEDLKKDILEYKKVYCDIGINYISPF